MMIIRILKWFNSGQSRRWLFLSTVSQLNWNLECCFLWRGKNWRTQRKTLGAGMRTNNKLSPYVMPGLGIEQASGLLNKSCTWQRWRWIIQNTCYTSIRFFLECEIVSKAKYCCDMRKRQRLDFCSCFLFIAPQKYFLFISGYTYFGMFFFWIELQNTSYQ